MRYGGYGAQLGDAHLQSVQHARLWMLDSRVKRSTYLALELGGKLLRELKLRPGERGRLLVVDGPSDKTFHVSSGWPFPVKPYFYHLLERSFVFTSESGVPESDRFIYHARIETYAVRGDTLHACAYFGPNHML